MKLRIDEVASECGLNMSQVQRQTGMTMSKLRRYWYNETRSAELDALELLLNFFRRYKPDLAISDLFVEKAVTD